MSCPTCDHTMHKIAHDVCKTMTYWCPRCGTLRTTYLSQGCDQDDAPKLVERAKEYMLLSAPSGFIQFAITSGLAESCGGPAMNERLRREHGL